MPTKKQIITIGVLCVIALGLGYWSGMPEKGSGQRAEVVAPTIVTNVVTNIVVASQPTPPPPPAIAKPKPSPTPSYATKGWLTNIDDAKKIAKNEKKLIYIVFTGSDWLPPCKALKKNVFDKQAFKEYAKENLVLVELDFPRDRSKITKDQYAYNRTQAKEYGISGYPTVFVLDANGKELLKRIGFGTSPDPVEAYIEMLKNSRFQ